MKTRMVHCLIVSMLLAGGVARAGDEAELERLQGRWEVVELIEDGTVIQRERIREWLPSGGRMEVVENAIVFTSPHDGRRHAKTFTIEPASYPKAMQLKNRDRIEAVGIYKFDGDRAVICMTNPAEAPRPTDFAAPAGSRRILMVLHKLADTNPNPVPGAVVRRPRPSQPRLEPVGGTATQLPSLPPATQLPSLPEPPAATQLPSPPPQRPVGVAGQVVTDAEVRQRLLGTWKIVDQYGAMFISASADGSYTTTREMKELRRFQEVFFRTPVTSGTWTVQNGTLTFRVTSSAVPGRVGQTFSFTVRSISDKDLLFIDGLGRVGSAVRVQ